MHSAISSSSKVATFTTLLKIAPSPNAPYTGKILSSKHSFIRRFVSEQKIIFPAMKKGSDPETHRSFPDWIVTAERYETEQKGVFRNIKTSLSTAASRIRPKFPQQWSTRLSPRVSLSSRGSRSRSQDVYDKEGTSSPKPKQTGIPCISLECFRLSRTYLGESVATDAEQTGTRDLITAIEACICESVVGCRTSHPSRIQNNHRALTQWDYYDGVKKVGTLPSLPTPPQSSTLRKHKLFPSSFSFFSFSILDNLSWIISDSSVPMFFTEAFLLSSSRCDAEKRRFVARYTLQRYVAQLAQLQS
jgi:hypothetical protein